MTELLDGLTQDLAVWRNFSARFQADVFCGLFRRESNEGTGVSSRTLVAWGERGLELDFDIYGPIAEEVG